MKLQIQSRNKNKKLYSIPEKKIEDTQKHKKRTVIDIMKYVQYCSKNLTWSDEQNHNHLEQNKTIEALIFFL